MVIWFAPKSSYILRIIPEKIELLLESKETIFECQRTKDGTILNQGKTNGEGLAVIKNLFKKILEVKATSKKKRAENR